MQGEMLPASAARVFSCSQIFLRIVNMLDLEQKARAVRLEFLSEFFAQFEFPRKRQN